MERWRTWHYMSRLKSLDSVVGMQHSVFETLHLSADVVVVVSVLLCNIARGGIKSTTWHIPDDRYVLPTQSMTLG
jgi:hypothetical protein